MGFLFSTSDRHIANEYTCIDFKIVKVSAKYEIRNWFSFFLARVLYIGNENLCYPRRPRAGRESWNHSQSLLATSIEWTVVVLRSDTSFDRLNDFFLVFWIKCLKEIDFGKCCGEPTPRTKRGRERGRELCEKVKQIFWVLGPVIALLGQKWP